MRRCLAMQTCAVMIGLAAAAFGQFDDPAPPGQRVDKQLTQRWKVGARITAVGGPCAGLKGTVPVPMEWPEQDVKIVDEDVSPFVRGVTYRNLDGVRQLVYSIPQLPLGQHADVLITFEITKRSVLAPENPRRFAIPKNLPKDVRLCLGPSPSIDVRHPSIRDAVKEITEGQATAWEQVEAIYDWVREKVKYENGKFKGAVETLRDKRGDKHDLTALFIALCRAHKVPARTVWIPDHAYAEFYLEEEQGKGTWFPCQVAGTRDFGSMSDLRPILQKGDNITVPEEPKPQRFVAEFLTGKALRGGGRPDAEFVRRLLPGN